MILKLPVPPIHYKQYKKYATLLHNVVNNALTLVMDISNTCDVTVSNRRIG